MKNIITILLVLLLPIIAYIVMEKNSSQTIATAKQNSLPTVMIFSSTMCMDCQKLKMVVNDIEDDFSDKVNFLKFNALDNDKKIKDYIKKYGITLVPTTIILDSNGNQLNKIEGYIDKEQFLKHVEGAINE